MERRKLSPDEVEEKLKSLEGWSADGESIRRRYEFGNFVESLAFVNKVGAIAEDSDHHPDITFGWGYAEVATTTHDRGGVTDMDFDLVRKISSVAP